jgi:peptidoglycan/xylan/chitin deacetylase (PgdA/CDA1 family)
MDAALDGALVYPEALQRQLILLRRDYTLISPEQFRAWRLGECELPPRSVLLTCDDGLQNVLHMLPLLGDNKCLFFLTGNSFTDSSSMLWHEELYLLLVKGRPLSSAVFPPGMPTKHDQPSLAAIWWQLVDYLSTLEREARLAALERLREECGVSPDWGETFLRDPANRQRFGTLHKSQLHRLLNAGHALGAHSLTHPVLSRMKAQSAWLEIEKSREDLEAYSGQTIWAFAYPFGNVGAVSDREVEFCKRAGFQCGFMNTQEKREGGYSWYGIPRVHVTREMTLAEFEAHVSGFHNALRCAVGQVPA